VGRYIARRLLSAIPTLFIVITLSFFLMRVAPSRIEIGNALAKSSFTLKSRQ
jgi:ABC-type dipeptide/oligopeptide/nickel transport system permease component